MFWAFSSVPLWCEEKKRIFTGGDSPPSSSLNHRFCKKFPALIQTLRKIDSTPVNRLQIHWQGKESDGAKNRGRRESQTVRSYAMVNGLRINHGKKNTIPHGPKLTHRRRYSMSEACLGSCPSRCFANEEDTCRCKWRAPRNWPTNIYHSQVGSFFFITSTKEVLRQPASVCLLAK